MTRVTSVRMSETLAAAVQEEASERNLSVSALITWVTGIALQSGLDVSALSDAKERFNCKVDFRLSDEMLSRLRPVCKQYGMSLSVYIRTIIYASYMGQLTLKQAGDRYTLVANYDQT